MLKLLWDLKESYQNSIILIYRTRKALRHKGSPIFLLIPTLLWWDVSWCFRPFSGLS